MQDENPLKWIRNLLNIVEIIEKMKKKPGKPSLYLLIYIIKYREK